MINSTYVTEHELTAEFENRIKELTGSKYAVSYTNGTVALYACLKSLGIGYGDEVIVPNMTFIASSNSIIMAGATPVFCEVLSDTLCIDPAKISKAITKKTKAIMPVHLYGRASDMKAINKIAEDNSLYVIEDAAQGVGVRLNGKHVGTFGDMGILSFYGNKTITSGEGGVILTDDEDLAKYCYRLKNHGRDEKGIFIHEHIGYNFCFTEMQAALGLSQLDKLPSIINRKREIYERYMSELSSYIRSGRLVPFLVNDDTFPVHWFTSFFLDDKEKLKEYLLSHNIQTRSFFYPLHLQPCYSDYDYGRFDYSISEGLYDRGISLPSSVTMEDKTQNYIIEVISNYLDGAI
jgi:perosamine synthetase